MKEGRFERGERVQVRMRYGGGNHTTPDKSPGPKTRQ